MFSISYKCLVFIVVWQFPTVSGFLNFCILDLFCRFFWLWLFLKIKGLLFWRVPSKNRFLSGFLCCHPVEFSETVCFLANLTKSSRALMWYEDRCTALCIANSVLFIPTGSCFPWWSTVQYYCVMSVDILGNFQHAFFFAVYEPYINSCSREGRGRTSTGRKCCLSDVGTAGSNDASHFASRLFASVLHGMLCHQSWVVIQDPSF